MIHFYDLSDSEYVYVSDSDPDPTWWIKDLELYKCDEESLQPGMELTENVINAAQKVLKQQFNIGGCQNTALPQSLKFVTESADKLCFQILHTGAP